MQVFKIEPTTIYSYGIALVAARDSAEAIKTYCATEFRDYMYDECKCTCNIIDGLYYETYKPTLIFVKMCSS